MNATAELIEMAEEIVLGCQHVGEHGMSFFGYEQLASKGRLLIAKLGKFGAIWENAFAVYQTTPVAAVMLPEGTRGLAGTGGRPLSQVPAQIIQRMRGAAAEILNSLKKNRLRTVEELVSADVLGDLREHADELFRHDYFLAAAIVLRVVLEERLRLLCASRQCPPTKPRPTIEDFNQTLYKHAKATSGVEYSKTEMMWVTAMAGVANEAAHGTKVPTRDDTERLARDVDSFLAKFSP